MFKQDMNKLESVQRKFTKRLKGLRNCSYEARLTHLGLVSLHCRRTKADLLMCYKIINNYTCTKPDFFFTFSSTIVTRGNSRKLNKSHTSSARDGHSFSKRIINMWNSLPDYIVEICWYFQVYFHIVLSNSIFIVPELNSIIIIIIV